jgi:hypothetical protein
LLWLGFVASGTYLEKSAGTFFDFQLRKFIFELKFGEKSYKYKKDVLFPTLSLMHFISMSFL